MPAQRLTTSVQEHIPDNDMCIYEEIVPVPEPKRAREKEFVEYFLCPRGAKRMGEINKAHIFSPTTKSQTSND
jgi:hypothetical protein